jgi:hypothetical protein
VWVRSAAEGRPLATPAASADVPGAEWPLPAQHQLEACWYRLLGEAASAPAARPGGERLTAGGDWVERWDGHYAFGSLSSA